MRALNKLMTSLLVAILVCMNGCGVDYRFFEGSLEYGTHISGVYSGKGRIYLAKNLYGNNVQLAKRLNVKYGHLLAGAKIYIYIYRDVIRADSNDYLTLSRLVTEWATLGVINFNAIGIAKYREQTRTILYFVKNENQVYRLRGAEQRLRCDEFSGNMIEEMFEQLICKIIQKEIRLNDR